MGFKFNQSRQNVIILNCYVFIIIVESLTKHYTVFFCSKDYNFKHLCNLNDRYNRLGCNACEGLRHWVTCVHVSTANKYSMTDCGHQSKVYANNVDKHIPQCKRSWEIFNGTEENQFLKFYIIRNTIAVKVIFFLPKKIIINISYVRIYSFQLNKSAHFTLITQYSTALASSWSFLSKHNNMSHLIKN